MTNILILGNSHVVAFKDAQSAFNVSVRCAPPNGADFAALVSTIDSGH